MTLTRLLRPKSIAVIGGGRWCELVVEQCLSMGFNGPVWPIHPKADTIAGLPVYRSVRDLPEALDACFIGVNRHATIEVVRELAARGAGGAVCFASGFSEVKAEDPTGPDLQKQLSRAAGDMPFLGPNCYGFINYLDGALLWPDQHGGQRIDCGVAIITQSSNIAINLTMQTRALPLAYIVTAGNQAQSGIAEIGQALLDDPRVTVLGLHIEAFGDLRAFEALALKAQSLGKSIIALKVGKSAQAQAATISHTASLAGGDAGANALLKRLNITRVATLPVFLETLKLLHGLGRLPSNRIATVSCSGGEASLAADIAIDYNVAFPPLNNLQKSNLYDALGPKVALANPLDYHTYIWRDAAAMTRAFAAMADPQLAIVMVIADYPRADRCDPSDWQCLTQAVISAKQQTGANFGIVATLPELMPEETALDLMAAGVIPFSGLDEAIAACAASVETPVVPYAAILLPTEDVKPNLVPEAESKKRLALYGLRIPKAIRCTLDDVEKAAAGIGFPVVLKGEGLAHKTEAGAVVLNLEDAAAVKVAACAMPTRFFLVEEMIGDTVAELLVGVVKDQAHGFVMTLAAGGILTELLEDSASFIIPAPDAVVDDALSALKIDRVLRGFRGGQPADRSSILRAIRCVQKYVMANAAGLQEIEINPLLCTPENAIAADALIQRKDVFDV